MPVFSHFTTLLTLLKPSLATLYQLLPFTQQRMIIITIMKMILQRTLFLIFNRDANFKIDASLETPEQDTSDGQELDKFPQGEVNN